MHTHPRPHPGAPQPGPGRGLPPLSGGGWFSDRGQLVPPDAPSELAALVGEFADVFRSAVTHSLAGGSRRTYRSGQAALIQFAACYGISMASMSAASPASFQFMGRQLALYLRSTRGVKAVTINQYISHCQTGLREVGYLHAGDLRSPLLATMLRGWIREDIRLLPRRLSMSIPATASVMQTFFRVADLILALDNRKRLEVKACAALTYYLALRPTEGAAGSRLLRDSDPDYLTEDAHHLRTSKVAMRFVDDQIFTPIGPRPPGRVVASIDTLQDTSKNTLQRGSQHRGAHANPRVDRLPFCVVALVMEYVEAFPPPPTGAFFPTILASDVSVVLRETARVEGLDPARLSARSLRSGSATMMRNLKNQLLAEQDLVAIRDHGNWAGDVGAQVYAHASPDAQRFLVPASLYDCGFMTTAYLRWFYMTPA